MKPAQNPAVTSEKMLKLNFEKKPKQNFDWINCSDVENRVVR